MNLQLRYFLQWSRVNEAWYCLECNGMARGVEMKRVTKKGKRETYFQQDYDSILHAEIEGDGNRLVHKQNCKFLSSYWTQLPVASELVA